MSRPAVISLFTKITTTDTEAKSKTKDIDTRQVTPWGNDMKGHAEICVERYFVVARKSVDQFSKKFPHPVWMDHQVTTDGFEVVGENCRCMCADCRDMCLCRANRWTRHIMGSQRIGSSCHKMEQCVWPKCWRDWQVISNALRIINTLVMSETEPVNASWVYSKNQILLEI